MNESIRNLGCVVHGDTPAAALAFIGLDGDGTATPMRFGELDALANGVARGLLRDGFQPGERIALLAANSVAFIGVVLGIMRAGMVAVPVNYRFPDALIDYVIADSGARLVFCDSARMASVPAALPSLLLSLEPGGALRRWLDPGAFQAFVPTADETAMMLYTSGSTGRPKGVLLSHAAHLWVVRTRLRSTPLEGEVALIAAPLYHMNALALALLTLAASTTAVMLPQFSAASYVTAIQQHRCTWLTAVPPMIAMMLADKSLLAQADLTSVRVVRMGSAPVSVSLLEQIRHWLPNARVINAYGTTEGGPVVFGPHPDGRPSPLLSVGYAHPEVAIRLRNEAGEEADEGVLELRSPGLMSGYHNRPDLALPFTADGYYVTGDVFRRNPDGFHTFVGRSDDMFVSGGENIYPSEVERVLERHPSVQQSCVVPVDDAIKGQKPVAFVVLRSDGSVSEDILKAFALDQAPAYQHPRRIWFVGALPLATTNKIDRAALKQQARQRLADEVPG